MAAGSTRGGRADCRSSWEKRGRCPRMYELKVWATLVQGKTATEDLRETCQKR